MENNVQYFSAGDLKNWTQRLFERLSVPPEEALTVAEVLVTTSLRGVDTHGLIATPYYARQIQKGHVTARPHIRIERESAATALVDGDNGLGIVVGVRAMQEAIRRASQAGAAVVGVHRSTHFGATAYYAQMAAAEGLIGLAMTNTGPTMAPWGGRSLLLGTNPLAIAVPGRIEGGLVLDMATTKVAWGKLRVASRAGRKIPLGWATDKDGRPTDDPAAGMEGLMLPIGDHKGYGLALMITILAATLTGAAHDMDIVHGQDIGHLFMAIDISRFTAPAAFQERLEPLLEQMQQSERLDGVDRIYLPGEIEAETMARRRQAGIPIPADLAAELVEVGQEVGVPFAIWGTVDSRW